MSDRKHNGTHQDHQRAAELHEFAEHAHYTAEAGDQRDRLSGAELSHLASEHMRDEAERAQHGSSGHIATFGHREIAALAHRLWCARGCPAGSPDEDWFRATRELRSQTPPAR